ncbi:2-hydroxyacid dehydrogenase [Algicella marina]|uniref:Glyoxylate/hydroxypyruvate reductase A n=1 Tax=Algicella marina TaxID=2683284 RepID=A0A6P1T4N3_9RHOB|nr:glyoxylate/hydroxypyruvate reductase A [Algicella marina]QHQ35502.1 glyoxylate/hydroxypyruvate reductase A [Algicella marina]
MTIEILYDANPREWPAYKQAIPAALKARGIDHNFSRAVLPSDADYVVYSPSGGIHDFTPFTRARAIVSLWAGVEKIVGNETLTQPLTRMIDPGLTQGMIEWVTGHVLRYHLGMDVHLASQSGDVWAEDVIPPLASERPVSILGLGALGAACGQSLARLGFPVMGWSRSHKSIPGIACTSGANGLKKCLQGAEILILLLPETRETHNILNAQTLKLMPQGARILNPGRGGLINDDALLAALDSGQIAHATLDVFREEPLPKPHPYWAHPQVTVTPHIASATRTSTAAIAAAETIAAFERGETPPNLVDRNLGY